MKRRRNPTTSSTNKSRTIGGSVDSFVEEIQHRFAKEASGLKNERVVGVVVAYGGEVAWSDIFASEDLFYKYWTKLLRSYAVEALARPNYREVAERDDAEQFLVSAARGHQEEIERAFTAGAKSITAPLADRTRRARAESDHAASLAASPHELDFL